MPLKVDMTGVKVGRLAFTKQVGKDRWGEYIWEAVCDCGTTKNYKAKSARQGRTSSCGCLRKEKNNNTRHGCSKHGHVTKTYATWQRMIRRCCSQKDKRWKDYGGRGISVCDRWADSFENFLKDMGEAPDGHSIDRIDNNGNYEPSNCRWATNKEQTRNKRTNVLITYQGRTQCVAAWAEEWGINRATLGDRLKAGWSVDKAFASVPIRTTQ
jgi:hypothetical protein